MSAAAEPVVTERVSAAASTAMAALLAGPSQSAELLAASPVATYLDTAPGVIALVVPAAARLPNAVLLNPADYAVVSPHVGAAEPMTVGDGSVRIGAVEITVARWWDPVPRLRLVDPAALRDALTRLRTLLPPWPEGDALIADQLVAGRAVLVDTLAGRAAPAEAAAALVGLGPGLTPAGDDVLAGAVAALAVFGPAVDNRRAGAPSRLAALAAAAAERAQVTTRLAADLTRHAAAGALAEPAAAVCRALADDGPLEPAVERLLAIGHTSGRDLAEGLLVGGLAVTGRYGG